MVKQDQQIGVIKAPWAVDANGKPVPTRYEITTEGITQIIDTDENTAYPVTADPEQHPWWWWAGTSVTCVAQVGMLVIGSAAIIAKAVTKVTTLLKKSQALSKAINKLGGVQKTFKAIYDLARGFVEGNANKYLTAAQRAALISIGTFGLELLGDALGIGGCISLVRALL